MSHLIVCLGKQDHEKIDEIIGFFNNIYLISEDSTEYRPRSNRSDQKISLLAMPDADAKSLSDALAAELKLQLSKDKMVDLDIAVHMMSGTGRLHAAVIAAVMKLGHGIRIVDVKDGKLVEL